MRKGFITIVGIVVAVLAVVVAVKAATPFRGVVTFTNGASTWTCAGVNNSAYSSADVDYLLFDAGNAVTVTSVAVYGYITNALQNKTITTASNDRKLIITNGATFFTGDKILFTSSSTSDTSRIYIIGTEQ